MPSEGDTITFSITVTNNGPDLATEIWIDDLLPPGVTFVDANGVYDSVSGAWDAGGLLAGRSVTLRITATVSAGTAGQTITNTASLAAIDQEDSNSANNDASAGILVRANPAVLVTKNGPVSARVGEAVSYTMVVGHDLVNGDGSPLSNIAVNDSLAGAATYVGGDTNSNGLLERGETWTFGVTRVVVPSDPDPLVNVATASGKDLDQELVAASDDHALDVVHPPVANDDTAATAEDTPVAIAVPGNDSDPDGNLDPTTVTVLSG
ncbi:MAG: hypothetical protein PHU43_02810, partial [Candidatus Bipolaricaulis sp.]|nr:hypothetical protein [Candidatus Bipolaricaulis sp.]